MKICILLYDFIRKRNARNDQENYSSDYIHPRDEDKQGPEVPQGALQNANKKTWEISTDQSK